jgi:hypothetical protein
MLLSVVDGGYNRNYPRRRFLGIVSHRGTLCVVVPIEWIVSAGSASLQEMLLSPAPIFWSELGAVAQRLCSSEYSAVAAEVVQVWNQERGDLALMRQ